jgi:hypothetical protein
MNFSNEDIMNTGLSVSGTLAIITFVSFVICIMLGFPGRAFAMFFSGILFTGITAGLFFIRLELQKEQEKKASKK